MLAIVVSTAGVAPWRKTFVARDIQIGRSHNNQLVLDDPRVSRYHASILVNDGGFTIESGPRAAVFSDGRELPKRFAFHGPQHLQIIDYTLAISQAIPQPIGEATIEIRGPVEQQLLDAIVAGDDASRLVYADWLEDRGDHARAEFLRAQQVLDGMPADDLDFEARTNRLRELAATVDLAWRSRVARRVIEGCLAFDVACPQQWSALTPTARDGVRHCGACRKDVHYCASVEEARKHAGQGRCVAIDITSPRWSSDLHGPFGRYVCYACQIDVGPGLEVCPRCHARVRPERMMSVGAISSR